MVCYHFALISSAQMAVQSDFKTLMARASDFQILKHLIYTYLASNHSLE